MKKFNRKEYLKQLLKKGLFSSEKNRIWTMCEATLQMLIMTVIEAEKAGLTDEQFYINFENSVNELSIKDHTKDNIENFKENLNKFIADSE